MRIEPAPSTPVASGTTSAATATAEPADEPPGVRSRFHGLRVTPRELRPHVCHGVLPSGVVVRPIGTQPSAISASLWLRRSPRFTAMGMPARGNAGSTGVKERKTSWKAQRTGSTRSSRARASATRSGMIHPMKWTRAVHHLAELAEKCGELPASFSRFQVVELWVYGDLLDVPRDLDVIQVALVTDLPVDEVPWLSEPV